jgi:siroheme synthase (precorrin-2 oxidase/ferrochelatase)
MSKIEEIVDALENKISKVLHKQEVLMQTNAKLSQQLREHEQKLLEQQDEIASWAEKYETLKIANTMLGSDDNKRETKLKINALIREIDHCISQLSE